MKKFVTCALVAAGLIVASCATQYVPPAGASLATLVSRAEGRLGNQTSLFRATSINCEDLTYLSNLSDNPPPVQIEAGRLTVLMTRARTPSATCWNVASFTPEAGRTYAIHVPGGEQCGLVIMDETGKTPADVRPLPVTGACAF